MTPFRFTLLILSLCLAGCQADTDAPETVETIGQGLPASQQMQSAPSAGVKFNDHTPFAPLSEDSDKTQ